MPAIVVRSARPDDQPALQRIFERASLGNAGDRDALLAHPEALRLSDDLVSRGRTIVATLRDRSVVGFASTKPVGTAALELEDLFVDPDWQRREVARRLVMHMISEAVTEGVTRIEVTANDHAMAFYRAAGFTTDQPVETQFGIGTRMHLDVPPQE